MSAIFLVGGADAIIVAHIARCGYAPTKPVSRWKRRHNTHVIAMSPSPTVLTNSYTLPTSCDVGYKYITVSDGFSTRI